MAGGRAVRIGSKRVAMARGAHPLARWFSFLTFSGATACGSPSPREVFVQDVVPLLEQNCLSSACHGVAPDAEARGEVVDFSFFFVRIRHDGTVADNEQAYERAKSRINTLEPGEFSSLLRKPLALEAGGEHHAGGHEFPKTDDPRYRILLDWIASETGGGEGRRPEELTDNQRLFMDDVLPLLATRQCMNQTCHGSVAPFTNFEPPISLHGATRFSTAAVAKNYEQARIHLHLGGDPRLSRLLRKTLPLDAGGIAHRGGNDIFFASTNSDEAGAIVQWANAERQAVLGSQTPEVRGVVFVRGPVQPQGAFVQDAFNPGTDLWVLEPATPGGKLRNLTQALHSQAADIRDPAVSHDGKRVAFAMRQSAADAFNIYEVGVEGDGFRKLTEDSAQLPGGGSAMNVQPTYGPDGRIYFASTRAGHLADGFDTADSEIWAVEPSSGVLERMTFSPSPEITPSFIPTGKAYGTLAFTMRRTIGARFEAPVFRMPLDHNKSFHGDPELHVHHGVSLVDSVVYGMRTLPDGRFSCVLLGRDNLWRGGTLAIFDRQFGPEIPVGSEGLAAVGGFRHAFSRVSTSVTQSGWSAGGLYRHPVPLPDGRILVTRAASALNLDDPGAAPDMGLAIVQLEEKRNTGEPAIAAETTLLDQSGLSEYDAEPIVVRPLEDDPGHAHAWDRERTTDTGVFSHRYVQTLEAIFSNLGQHGAKSLRTDLAYARFVEAIPTTPALHGAAPTGLSSNMAARLLGEVPLMGGSVFASVPADRAFRLQLLDSDRMAVGTQHNRWIYVAPGEKFPGGVSPELYPVLCAGCHGGLSGKRGDVGGPVPDLITTASVTLATHENLDPRRPLAPVVVGSDPTNIVFQGAIASMLEASCVSCHAGADPAGGLSLERTKTAKFDAAYEALLAAGSFSGGDHAYVDATTPSARQSYLLERVLGRELDAPRKVDGQCPGDPPLTDAQKLDLIRLIDVGAPYRSDGAP